MTESKTDQKEPREPVMTESQLVGKIRSIADGKDGITAFARSVRFLDERVERLREKILAQENEIADMSNKYGVLGEMFGTVEALFRGKLDALEKAKEECTSLSAEIQKKSASVYDGMSAIEEAVDAYVKSDRNVKTAEALLGLLERMRMFSALCVNAIHSITRSRETGNQEEVASALELIGHNASLFRSALNEYERHIKKAPQWSGDLDVNLGAMADVDMIRESQGQIARNKTALQEKVAGYILEKRAKFSSANFTDEDKEYFKQRATL